MLRDIAHLAGAAHAQYKKHKEHAAISIRVSSTSCSLTYLRRTAKCIQCDHLVFGATELFQRESCPPDPLAVVAVEGWEKGSTPIAARTVNPRWDAHFKLSVSLSPEVRDITDNAVVNFVQAPGESLLRSTMAENVRPKNQASSASLIYPQSSSFDMFLKGEMVRFSAVSLPLSIN